MALLSCKAAASVYVTASGVSGRDVRYWPSCAALMWPKSQQSIRPPLPLRAERHSAGQTGWGARGVRSAMFLGRW